MKIDVEESKIYSFNDPSEDLYLCGMLNVGKNGYFSDSPDFFDCVEGVLESVNVRMYHSEENYFPFRTEQDHGFGNFKFFCPEAYAIGAPKLRPYKTLDELPFKVGDTVTFRDKTTLVEHMVICVGTGVNNSRLAYIHLGAYSYEPEDLFGDFEWFNGKEWVPFGVEA